jgi:lysine-N-methylase
MLAGKMMFIQPRYVSKFRCIGTECEDSCCSGWDVIIDKSTYEKYRKCSDRDLRSQMDKQITRTRSSANDDDYYAKVNLNSEGSCPFLDAEKLCVIQKTMGEEYLSKICVTYPRSLKCIDGRIERSLTMSCPTAIRLALLDPGLMEFDEVEDQLSIQNTLSANVDTQDVKYTRSLEKYFWDLRIFTITILQKRKYLLWERLIILGLFFDDVGKRVTENKLDTIPQVISKYGNMVEQNFLRKELEKIPVKNTVQINLIKALVEARCNGVNASFVECISKFTQGIQYNSEDSIEVNTARYEEICRKYYAPYMEQKEYILEHYMVNYVFKTIFPLGSEKHCFDNYIMMIVHYAMIKMLLIGITGFYKEEFGDKHVIKLIQSFAKTIENNSVYLKNVFNCLTENEVTSMAYMAILIKN